MGVPVGSRVGRAWGRRAGSLVLGLWAGLLLAGCEPTDPAESAARLFVDRYYVELDLKAARPYATGLALAKLTREEELLAGIDAPVSAGKPSVHYRLVEQSPEVTASQRSYLFELTISFSDAQVIRMALVTLQAEAGGAWKVANFEELR